ncbi:23S rRNA pseudouridine2605 synthase [Dethiosulfovibrio salsuginis]|uniref:Pseudouridine synthase n=2 Tax=Dethiosulfovibrio salsuginis TaxID=561720 RepID=A0A1X7IBM2_9BACT|nr:23S rRNA pseudouridine2605 synthase [Dethiosulfovibrio salsuginis]
MRLNRYLALCGVASRRASESFIADGRVSVDGVIVFDPAQNVEPEDVVEVDGKPVSPESLAYFIINKPKGYVCASSDRFDPTVLELIPEAEGLRLYTVGRLDKNSQGLLILTNDGDFCNELIHPSAGYTKTYELLLDEPPGPGVIGAWRKGVNLSGKTVVPVSLEVMDKEPFGRWLSIELSEGLKREIRAMASSFSLSVRILFRRKIGRMELRRLRSGEYRSIGLQEMWRAIRQGGIV